MAKVHVMILAAHGGIRREQIDLVIGLMQQSEHQVSLGFSSAKPVTNNRCKVVSAFLDTDADWLLMVDDDVVPHGNPLSYVGLDLDVLMFPCPLWKPGRGRPVVWNFVVRDEDGNKQDVVIGDRSPVVEVSEGGTGMMLIHRRVLEHPAIRQVPFVEEIGVDGISVQGHDLFFCTRAREVGFRVWAATGCPCSHFEEVDLREVYLALQRDELLQTFVPPRLALKDKRLIFSLNPSRCGTRSLAEMLDTVPGVTAHHEPWPDFADVMRIVQADRGTAYRFWLEQKLPTMLSLLERVGTSTYVETSHVFGKGFLGPLLDLGVVPDLIVLRRPAQEVALSMWRRNDVPARSKKGVKYHLAPDDPDVLIRPEGWESWHDYQLCYWSVLEFEARAAVYTDLVRRRGGMVVETSLAEIVTDEGFVALLEALGLPAPDLEAYASVADVRWNANPAEWDQVPDGIDRLEREVNQWKREQREKSGSGL